MMDQQDSRNWSVAATRRDAKRREIGIAASRLLENAVNNKGNQGLSLVLDKDASGGAGTAIPDLTAAVSRRLER